MYYQLINISFIYLFIYSIMVHEINSFGIVSPELICFHNNKKKTDLVSLKPYHRTKLGCYIHCQ